MLCQPHLTRGQRVPADLTVAGEPMCCSCVRGRAVSAVELAGEIGADSGREADHRYYAANRDRVLETHRRWREGRKQLAPCAG